MLKFNELKSGDIVMAEYDGQQKEGEIKNVDNIDRKVCVATADGQEFWYEPKHLVPIALDESQLFKLGFQKEANGDGSAKYSLSGFLFAIPMIFQILKCGTAKTSALYGSKHTCTIFKINTWI